MNHRPSVPAYNSRIINGTALGFSILFLLASLATACFVGEWGHVFLDSRRIMISPCPLVTDYLAIGGLSSAFLNAGACGLACFFFMVLLKGDSHANTLAGYFLVVAHCFYGLNFLNMWPCFLAPFLYMKRKGLDFKENLHICMFATSFAPFISEFLFRYTLGDDFVYGQVRLTVSGVVLAILFSILLAFVLPAILPGARAWHKGYNLYNGGLAFGIFGFFVFNFMYRTMGIEPPQALTADNVIYDYFNRSYRSFATLFFLAAFSLCTIAGYILNGRSFKGFRHLVTDTGYSSNFAEKYGMPLCLINIGCYGFLFLLYIHLITHFTGGRLHWPHHRRHRGSPDLFCHGTASQERLAHSGRISAPVSGDPGALPHGEEPGDRLDHLHPGLHKRRGLRHRPLPHRRTLWDPCRTGRRLHVRLHVYGHQCSPRRSGAL